MIAGLPINTTAAMPGGTYGRMVASALASIDSVIAGLNSPAAVARMDNGERLEMLINAEMARIQILDDVLA